MLVFVAALAAIVVAGCGRVNLEDLTPAVARTEIAGTASAIANAPTPTQIDAPSSVIDAFANADIAGGSALYNTWCSGCHDGGRAQPVKGKVLDPAEWIPKLRANSGAADPHKPTYTEMELNDQQMTNILAYIASVK
jgi:cytochrome c5